MNGRDAGPLADQVRSVMTLVEHILDVSPPARSSPGDRLESARRAVAQARSEATRSGDSHRAMLLHALGEQITYVRAALAQQIGTRRALSDVQGSLARLRSIDGVDQLVERAPAELGQLGYTRVLMSRIQDGTWLARSAFARDDPTLAAELVAAGRARPRALDADLLETTMVRQRRTMLVPDAQRNQHIHRELVTLTRTEAYVAAPLLSRDTVVGLLHADKDADAGRVDDTDRELLGSFAEGLGLAMDRAVALARLETLRVRLGERLSSVAEVLDECAGTGRPWAAQDPHPSAAPEPLPRTVTRSTGRWSLTSREREVLHAMADGLTNARIAARLFVSEATVKYHVKNVLRKTGAANRADAIARYYRDESRSDG